MSRHRLGANQGPALWLRPGVTHVWIFGKPAQDSHPQIVTTADLAGEPHVLRNLIEGGEFVALDVGHRSCITVQDLHPARRAPRISTTTMQDVNSGVHDGQHESLTIECAGSSDSLHLNDRHESLPSPIPNFWADPTTEILPAGFLLSMSGVPDQAWYLGPPTNRCRNRSENSAACGPASTTDPLCPYRDDPVTKA
jgi:hypothetical protein